MIPLLHFTFRNEEDFVEFHVKVQLTYWHNLFLKKYSQILLGIQKYEYMRKHQTFRNNLYDSVVLSNKILKNVVKCL